MELSRIAQDRVRKRGFGRRPLKVILSTKNLNTRLQLALAANDLKKNDLSTIVSDVFNSSTLGSKGAIARFLFESGLVGKLNAAVAEDLGTYYQVMLNPPKFSESVASGSSRYALWLSVEDFISKLDTNNKLIDSYFANYLAFLFTNHEISSPNQLEDIRADWNDVNKELDG